MDAFDLVEEELKTKIKHPQGDPFDQVASELGIPEEPWYKSLARTLYQVPSGIAQGITFPLDIASMAGTGESLDPEEIEHLKKISEREGVPFDEEKYMEAVQGAQEAFPTQSNIERAIEEKTGAPLTPKTRLQKGLKFASTAGKLAPKPGAFRGINVSLPKPVLGGGVEAVKEGLQEAGLPEPIAELASFAVLKKPAEGSAALTIGKKTKPSGLIERQFEKTTEPKKVSEKTLENINKKVESDFKEISDKIIKESPIGETFENLKNDPTFKQESRELLDQAQVIADSMTGKISGGTAKKYLENQTAKSSKGFAPNDYDKSYSKFMKEAIKDIPDKNVSPGQLVEQYRKNNSALSEYFEPGASKAQNRAKRDALLDQNRAIASLMEKEFPESKLSKVFKEGNDRWTKIMDSEAVDAFVDKIFSEKINYKKINDFFEKQGYEFKFKRALGPKGYADFKLLLKDMLTTEAPYKMLKVAEKKTGYDWGKTAFSYLIHPKLAGLKIGKDAAQGAYKGLMNYLLDKPKLALKWENGIKAFKKGNFATAEKELKSLQEEIKIPEKSENGSITSPEMIKLKEEQNKQSKPEKKEKIKPRKEKKSKEVQMLEKRMEENGRKSRKLEEEFLEQAKLEREGKKTWHQKTRDLKLKQSQEFEDRHQALWVELVETINNEKKLANKGK